MTSRNVLSASAIGLAMGALLVATPALADWHGGYGGRGRSHHGWSGGGIAAGIIGGLALGALATGASRHAYAAPAYGVEPDYDAPLCYRDVRPVHDRWGRYMGERVVRVCE